MTADRPVPARSLRRRILVTASLGVVIGGGGLAALFALNARAQDRLFAATDAVMEEQAIADRITEAVMRQLLAVSTLQASGVPSLSAEFRSAGDVVQAEIRTYLFRDLSPDERLRLEAVKEAHQRLEVAAARATELFARGEVREGGGSSEAMLSHAHALLDELTAFLAMRKEQLQRDRLQQVRAVRITYGAWVAVALVLLFGSLVLGRFLRRRVAAPLSVLAAAARRIGGGDLTLRVPEDFDAEFSELARSFNRMSEGLTELTADLEGRNTELMEALQHVQAAQAELMQAEKLGAMGRMTAGLAHELNNPLASVLGFGELLALRLAEEGDPRLREINEELVVPILDEARRAHDLVHSLLQFARRSDPALGPVRVRESLDVVVALREFAFTRAGLTLEIGEVPDVHIVGERQRLQEIFLNITNNALDAMKGAGKGALRITGTSEGEFLVLRFDDEGPGLAQPDRVFEPFFTTKPLGEGTGLGLALVHKFTEEFGGTVQALRAPHGGASFVLRFRTAEAPPDQPEHAVVDLDSPKRLATVEDRAPRVLVVEDELNLRRLQQRILAGIGADVLLASDAAEARRLLDEHEVDLVVSDVKMPGESGLSFFRWVTLAHPRLTDHFFFVTGDTGDPEIISLVQEHPDMFICKPFEMREYTERVALFLGRSHSPEAGS